jgi:AraC-like DNA-binding protein
MGESTLSRNFRADTGQTLKAYLKDQVVYRSKRSLAGGGTIREVATSLGFEDEFYFSKFFKRETGFSPKQYRESLERNLD